MVTGKSALSTNERVHVLMVTVGAVKLTAVADPYVVLS